MRLITKTIAVQLLFLLVAGNAWAQFQTDWERTSREDAANPMPSWFGTTTERSIAYGMVGGEERLYVASRAGEAITIRVIDPNTGEDLDDVEISTAGITGGTLPFNTIDVSDDGRIFVSNLVSPVSAENPFKVYMWDDEESAPTVVIEYGDGSVRLGDNIHVAGSVTDGTAVIYAAASNVDTVVRWAMVGDEGSYEFQSTPTVFDDLPSMSGWGSPGWAVARGPGADARFYANGRSNTFVREYDATGETKGYIEWPAASLNQNVGSAEFVSVEGNAFLAVYLPTQRRAALVALNESAADGVWAQKYESIYAAFPVLGATVENSNGDLSFRYNEDGSITVFVLTPNNGIGAYTTESLLPGPLTVAEVRDLELGSTATFEAVVSRSRGAFSYAQDQTAGISIRQTSGAFRDSVVAGSVREGTRIRITGTTSEFRHLLQINQGDIEEWEIISQDNVLTPVDVTLEELAENGEQYEGMLVRVADLTTSSAAGTFAAGTSYAISDPTLAEGTIELRVPNAADTDIAGAPMPESAFTFTGAVGQFSTTEADVGYQLMIVERGDIYLQPTILEDLVWRIDPLDEPWLLPAGNTMRGGAYNPATDHVLVVSRAPALGVHILLAGSGQAVGQLDVTGVTGGTFPLSEIAVTEDGQIFGANLHVEGQGIKIYRWEDENAAPEVVFEGNLNGRAGDSFTVAGSGDEVRIYISGTFNDSVAIFEWDGSTTTGPRYITAEATVDRARMGIAEVPGGESIWINGPGTALAEISTTDGEILREVSLDVLPSGFGDIAYFEFEEREYILAGSAHQAVNIFYIVDVTVEGEEFVAFTTPDLGIFENLFFTGFAAFDTRRSNVIVGGTNVTVAAFSLGAEFENEAPTASEILSPAENAEFRIEGEGDTEFAATWSEATDPDGTTVVYRWQLSASPTFDDLLVDAYVGTETSYTTDFATIASIMDEAGVAVDGSLTVYHRVVTSDGDVETAGEASSVVLVRGTLTNTEPDLGLPSEFALHGNYPNPFNPTTNIRFDLPQAADVQVQVFDILGRRVMSLQHAGMQAGANQTIAIDAGHLASGTYLYRIVVEMSGVTRVETGKMLLVK
jgi:hypothetical protein